MPDEDWKKVSEVLPQKDQKVIAWSADGKNQTENLMQETYFNGRDFVYGYHNNWMRDVTHWMPFPDPPETEA